jgi:chromate reductase
VAAFAGSLRRDSLNRAALVEAAELAPDGMEIEIHDLHEIPLFNADDEKTTGFPPAVERLRAAIGDADAVLIATPEYNFSVTGVLKNALDWLSRPDSPLDGKPAAILGAGGRLGTIRSQLHLREILIHNRMPVVQSPQVLIDRAAAKFDGDGRLTDERHRDQIARLLAELTILVERHR